MSLRGYVVRMLVKYVVAPRFKRAYRSVPELRRLTERLTRSPTIPPGTEFRSLAELGGFVGRRFG